MNISNEDANFKKVLGIVAMKTFLVSNKATIKNLSLKAKVQKDRFEAKLNVIAHQKGLIYLEYNYKNINISLLIDLGATNLFVNETYAWRLKLKLSPIAKPIKVAFA